MKFFSKISVALALIMFACGLIVAPNANAATYIVSNFSELQTKISSATGGDVIELSSDVVLTSRLTISNAITIDGKGYSLTVPVPGVDESGLNASSASSWGLFVIDSSNEVLLKNLTILGGNANVAGITVNSGKKLKIDNVKIERTRSTGAGGGAIQNSGTLTIENSYFRRNSADYGAAFANIGGTVIINNSSFVENRSPGAGGAIESKSNGTMWVNNSTFAHNYSNAGGGAINNYGSTLYVSHSSFVGNVNTGPYDGGAILTFSGGVSKIVSSIFAFNYGKLSGSNSLILDDIGNTDVQQSLTNGSGITIAKSLLHAPKNTWPSGVTSSNETIYPAALDGNNDTLFSGGAYDYPTDGRGQQVSTYGKAFRPNLLIQNGMPTAALQSPNSTSGLNGAPVAFEPSLGKLSYYNGSAWVSLVGSVLNSQNVITDQIGASRSSSSPRVGALEGGVAQTYLVSSPSVSGGTVSGASVFGDVYNANDVATITAIPASGKTFSAWSISINGGSATSSTTNPLSLTVTGNTTVTPTFINAAAGSRTVTYTATGADSGTPPAAVTSSGDVTISTNAGSMIKAGYVLSKWNTAANGSGTDYALGVVYSSSSSANLTLYPIWTVQTVFAITYDANGATGGSVPNPTTGSGIVTLASNSNSLIKSGFNFAGWNTSANGNGITYTAGADFNLTADVTLFAKWTAVVNESTPADSSSSSSQPSSSANETPVSTTTPESSGTTKTNKSMSSQTNTPSATPTPIETVTESPLPTPTPSSDATDTITLTQAGNENGGVSTGRFLLLAGLLVTTVAVVIFARKN